MRSIATGNVLLEKESNLCKEITLFNCSIVGAGYSFVNFLILIVLYKETSISLTYPLTFPRSTTTHIFSFSTSYHSFASSSKRALTVPLTFLFHWEQQSKFFVTVTETAAFFEIYPSGYTGSGIIRASLSGCELSLRWKLEVGVEVPVLGEGRLKNLDLVGDYEMKFILFSFVK